MNWISVAHFRDVSMLFCLKHSCFPKGSLYSSSSFSLTFLCSKVHRQTMLVFMSINEVDSSPLCFQT